MKVLRAVQRFKNLIERRATDQPANAVEEAMEAELLWVKAAELSDLKTLSNSIFSRMRREYGIAVDN